MPLASDLQSSTGPYIAAIVQDVIDIGGSPEAVKKAKTVVANYRWLLRNLRRTGID